MKPERVVAKFLKKKPICENCEKSNSSIIFFKNDKPETLRGNSPHLIVCLCEQCFALIKFNKKDKTELSTEAANNKLKQLKKQKEKEQAAKAKGYELAGFTSYKEYLNSPLWKEIRRKALQKRKHVCCGCGNRASQIHHSSYKEDVMLDEGRYLYALCSDCHKYIEFNNGKKNSLEEANRKLLDLIKQRPAKYILPNV